MNPEQFQLKLAEHNIDLDENQLEQFNIYFKELVSWNEKVNLTNITEKDEVYLKHFYDSITPAFYTDLSKETKLCDVGSGAGFPSIPLKICFPHIEITIVDSLKKRIDFLAHLASKLNLTQVNFHHSRAEDFGKNKQHREQYDIVTARAVARMSVLSELCLPLVKKNGMFIAMKGSKGQDELSEAKTAIKLLGGKTEREETFILPKEDSERSMFFIKKERNTPRKYPRKAGTPNRDPIK